mgnify:FL=1|jgi:hypothetical protein
MPGVAFGEAAGGKPTSLYYTVMRDCFLGVAGASGVEPTVMPHKRTQQNFVAGNKEYKEATHQCSVA